MHGLKKNQVIIFKKLKQNPDKWFLRRELDELVPLYTSSGILIKLYKLGLIEKTIKEEPTGRKYGVYKLKKEVDNNVASGCNSGIKE